MPKQRVGDIEIYYEAHGEGPQTLAMIRGLGSNLLHWYEQTPVFSRHFRTVVFDNRGAGRTDKPDRPYSIRQMADDTAGLMDALGIRRAALLGISMGGGIAQEFALNYPDRLSCLILGCTAVGGAETVRADPQILEAVSAGPDAGPEQQRLQLRAVLTDHAIEHRPDVVAKYEEVSARYPIPRFAFIRQLEAILTHQPSGRLASIGVPTLVLTGGEDRLVPPENSRILAERIPSAVLKELPGGHLFFTEYPEEFNRAVIDFVTAHP